MQEDIVPRMEWLHSSAELGRLEVEPLSSGFGLTLGNALRRVLLSSLPGAAVVAMRIEDVYHEFSAIPGVREDTTELILNLKQVRLKSYKEGEAFQPVNVRLEGTGPGVLTAGDIQVPPDLEIVNPELAIATLDNREARLSMLLTVEMDKGYRTAEGQESPAIGVIPIDAVFTPIRRVNFQVEKTRVGERTDYDKLLLEIQTDGTITPKEALNQAAQILTQQVQFLLEPEALPAAANKKTIAEGPVSSAFQELPIEVLDLSSRTYNCLKRSQITTVGQVLQMSEDELLGLRNFGQKSLVELQEKLAEHQMIRQGENGSARAAGADDSEDDDDEAETEAEEELESSDRDSAR